MLLHNPSYYLNEIGRSLGIIGILRPNVLFTESISGANSPKTDNAGTRAAPGISDSAALMITPPRNHQEISPLSYVLSHSDYPPPPFVLYHFFYINVKINFSCNILHSMLSYKHKSNNPPSTTLKYNFFLWHFNI